MSNDTSAAAALRGARERLAPDACAQLDAELLLASVLQIDRAALYAHPGRALSAQERTRYGELVAQRARGVPTAYLLGSAGFWTFELAVDGRVLVPRPETELLVEAALARVPGDTRVCIADLGTGSGAVALALALERPRAQIVATDCSNAALAVARTNAAALGAAAVNFVCASWLGAFGADTFDIIASNPPYIAPDEAASLPPELAFEPLGALICDDEGLAAIAAIAADAPRVLTRDGWLLVEHGATQGAAVRALFARAGLTAVETCRDLNGHERVTLGCASAGGAGNR